MNFVSFKNMITMLTGKVMIHYETNPEKSEDPSNVLEATGDFGRLVTREIIFDDFRIWQADVAVSKTTKIRMSSLLPFLGLTFVLKNNFDVHFSGKQHQHWYQHQHNLYYMHRLKCTIRLLAEEEYTFFGIEFSTDYLKRYSLINTRLVEFLERIENEGVVFFRNAPFATTFEMLATIKDMQNCKFTSDHLKMFLESKVVDLLRLFIEQNFIGPTIIPAQDLILFAKVKEYILKDVAHPGSLAKIAFEFGININKLKTGFKQVHNITVYQFIFDARMLKARKKMGEGNYSLKEIAALSGYKRIQSFTAAFKRKYGYPPSAVKRGLAE